VEEVTQTLYVHMNIIKKRNKKKERKSYEQ
jgi:hypothetical protein